AIFGMLAAGAILFPRMQVYVFFGLFPLPFPVVAIILVVINMLNLLHGDNAGGAAAHLAGMAAGAVYVLWPKLSKGVQTKSQSVQWESKINRERNFQAEVDRILDKVHNHGIASLSRKEKKMLREATQREQQERGR
ncbi:MAG: rhomboid family intramembrane serine protease, partial [Planctomycetes bacterium]|nr:rhomboid family intramembrane serine protease [Planctomycetota bacterium]